MVAVFFVGIIAAPAAIAQPDNRNDYERAYDECMESHNFTEEGSVARAIADSVGGLSDAAKRAACADRAGTENPGDAVATAAGWAASEFWGDPIGDFTKSLMEGNAQALQTVMTFWMDYSTAQTANIDANVQGVKNIVFSISGVALVASFLIGGWKIASSRRMGLQDGVEETGEVVVKYIIFSTAVPALVPGALVASDMLADAIMDNFGVTDPATFVELTALTENMAGPIIILGLALVSFIGAVVQLLAMVTRVLILPIVTGLMPLAAASSFSQTGRSFLGHTVAFMIAAIAYKPIAALARVLAPVPVPWTVPGRPVRASAPVPSMRRAEREERSSGVLDISPLSARVWWLVNFCVSRAPVNTERPPTLNDRQRQ